MRNSEDIKAKPAKCCLHSHRSQQIKALYQSVLSGTVAERGLSGLGRQAGTPLGLAQDQKRVELLISVIVLSVSATATARNSQVLFRLISNLLITFGRQLSRSTIQLHFYYYYYFIFVY